ncbi:MAG: DUF1294 domain-containing protein [Lachnospiraceae bacterium]|nr:DUF1294 domain-containing protein [Lachnospiraceae bacterium]
MEPFVLAVIIWLCVANIAALILFGADKKRAKEGRWRIPEKTLFLSAILGGSIGAILGMHLFRHKTKHWYFRYGLPAILLAQIGLGLWLSGVLG